MTKLYNDVSKIFLLCPSDHVTGGTELLHQLCDLLNNLGKNAYMHYIPRGNRKHFSVPDAFKKYNIKIDEVVDEEHSLIVVPEIYADHLMIYKKAKLVFWWLSVDNFYKKFEGDRKKWSLKRRVKSKLKSALGVSEDTVRISNKVFNNPRVNHWVQSYYAQMHLKGKGFMSEYLSDYINDDFFKGESQKKKQDIILFNPLKGYEHIKRIQDEDIDGIWVPITAMTRKNVIRLMNLAKVYIDFGNHPGKDRIPREAAVCGCCVITNRQGSAFYAEDVGIPDEFKFEKCDQEISKIREKINQCIVGYDDEAVKFSDYISDVGREKEKFINDVKNIFNIRQNR